MYLKLKELRFGADVRFCGSMLQILGAQIVDADVLVYFEFSEWKKANC